MCGFLTDSTVKTAASYAVFGISKLGHTEPCASGTRDLAPPVQCACQLSALIVLLSIKKQGDKNV